MRGLGFCVSIDHARFMARHFTKHGIPSVAVWGDSPRDERHAALRDLAAGAVRAVLSVDLFNEGVDVPAVDTVLMRSEERRVGKECVSTCRSRWSPYH